MEHAAETPSDRPTSTIALVGIVSTPRPPGGIDAGRHVILRQGHSTKTKPERRWAPKERQPAPDRSEFAQAASATKQASLFPRVWCCS